MRLLLCILIVSIILFRAHAASQNVFEYNLRKRVHPDDEGLNRALWAGVQDSPYETRRSKDNIITYKVQNRYSKRATEFNPLIHNSNCLLCPNEPRDLADLSVEKNFQASQMRALMIPGAQTGTCLFYGQRQIGDYPPSLSRSAAKATCNRKLFGGDNVARAIWHLWPNDKSRSCEAYKDFYCLDAWSPKCCWLNPLMKGNTKNEREPLTRPYFQQMSKAMAQTCVGEVYVMHDRPDNIKYQDPRKETSIWLTHELPALQQLYRQGIVTQLWVIPVYPNGDAKDSVLVDAKKYLKETTPQSLEVDEEVAKWLKERKEYIRSDEYIYRNRTAHLQRRWSDCLGGADEENEELDYFG